MSEQEEVAPGKVQGESEDSSPIFVAEDENGGIEYNDSVLMIDRDTATMIADEGLITYRIKDAYGDDGKIRSARSLSKTPPVLEFFTIDKNTLEPVSVSYQLTAHVTENLSEVLSQLDKAYKGTLYTGSDQEIRDKVYDILDWAKEHKIKSGFSIMVVALFVFLIVYSFMGG